MTPRTADSGMLSVVAVATSCGEPGGRAVGIAGALVGVVVGVRDDEPGRREHEDGDVAADDVAVERRLEVDEVRATSSPASAAETTSPTRAG